MIEFKLSNNAKSWNYRTAAWSATDKDLRWNNQYILKIKTVVIAVFICICLNPAEHTTDERIWNKIILMLFHLKIFIFFSMELFRHACILSGCDYIASLPGIGLTKAFKFFNLTEDTDTRNVSSFCVTRLLHYSQVDGWSEMAKPGQNSYRMTRCTPKLEIF